MRIYRLIAARLVNRVRILKGDLEGPAAQLAESFYSSLTNVFMTSSRKRSHMFYFHEIQKFYESLKNILLDFMKSNNRTEERVFAESLLILLREILIVASSIDTIDKNDTVLVYHDEDIYHGKVLEIDEYHETVTLSIECAKKNEVIDLGYELICAL
jgi:hypothetical protein